MCWNCSLIRVNEFDSAVTLWVSGRNKSLLRHLSDIAAAQVSLPECFDQDGSERGGEKKSHTWNAIYIISIFSKSILAHKNLEIMCWRKY